MTEACETCRFWIARGREPGDGRRRAHPPVYLAHDRSLVFGWPLSSGDDWRGE